MWNVLILWVCPPNWLEWSLFGLPFPMSSHVLFSWFIGATQWTWPWKQPWFNPATTFFAPKALVSWASPILFSRTLQWLFFPFKLSKVEDNVGRKTSYLPYCWHISWKADLTLSLGLFTSILIVHLFTLTFCYISEDNIIRVTLVDFIVYIAYFSIVCPVCTHAA